MSSYWFRAHGRGVTGWRIFLAATVGKVFPLAYYLAPKWKRDKWHRIACDSNECSACAEYYRQFEGIELAAR